jgi:phosphoribosylformylglycinamidine synthase
MLLAGAGRTGGFVSARYAIVVFPGSNCDRDAMHMATDVLHAEARFVWHKETALPPADVVVLPGGFSYGDYLRCGAMAKLSPIMDEVRRFAARGGPVIGICNGFQVLTEAGMLPGALLRNASLKFACREVRLAVEDTRTPFTRALSKGDALRMPVAHGEGNYFIDDEGLRRLEGEGQVVFRYADGTNPNGSLKDIAGVCNEARNVVGLMPHPERACEGVLGSADGLRLFEALR